MVSGTFETAVYSNSVAEVANIPSLYWRQKVVDVKIILYRFLPSGMTNTCIYITSA